MNNRFFVSMFGSKRKLRALAPYDFAKRSFDFVLATGAIILLSPLFLAVAILIRLGSSGGVIFCQPRYGLNGKIFCLYKFRTMYQHHCDDGETQSLEGDHRVTKIGLWLRRSMIDELPQLINVLKGEMSLVGPRPHPVPLDQYYAQHLQGYWRRYQCKPGLTGSAQVSGYRGPTPKMEDMAKRLAYDLYYIRHQNLWLDVKILFGTMLLLF